MASARDPPQRRGSAGRTLAGRGPKRPFCPRPFFHRQRDDRPCRVFERGPIVACMEGSAISAIVEAQQVFKTYKGKVATPALRGVDLEIGQGAMVAVRGRWGCG